MRNLSNIEKSGFHKGQYVGYCHGPWTIKRTNSSYGNWIATTCNHTDAPIYAFTLSQMSNRLRVREKEIIAGFSKKQA